MGKEFLRAKNQRFRRGRDEQRYRMHNGDLFSNCRPATRTLVIALSTNGSTLAPGSKVFSHATEPTVLYSGTDPVLRLPGSLNMCGPLVGRVVEVDETGVHRVEVGTLGRESL